MKIKPLILLIAMLIATQTSFTQTTKQIASIRYEVNLINKNLKKYSKTTKMVEGISLEGTEAKYFLSDKGLKKISAKMYGETYNASVELYYSGEELIFAYQKVNRYDTQIGMTPSPKVVSVKETRFYFLGGKLVKISEGKRNIKTSADSWEASEREISDLSQKLKDALYSKD